MCKIQTDSYTGFFNKKSPHDTPDTPFSSIFYCKFSKLSDILHEIKLLLIHVHKRIHLHLLSTVIILRVIKYKSKTRKWHLNHSANNNLYFKIVLRI